VTGLLLAFLRHDARAREAAEFCQALKAGTVNAGRPLAPFCLQYAHAREGRDRRSGTFATNTRARVRARGSGRDPTPLRCGPDKT
jgi:hypothetical protein